MKISDIEIDYHIKIIFRVAYLHKDGCREICMAYHNCDSIYDWLLNKYSDDYPCIRCDGTYYILC